MRLKIVSDGSIYGTRLVDVETGEPVDGVASIQWEHIAGEPPRAVIRFGIDLETEIDLDYPRKSRGTAT